MTERNFEVASILGVALGSALAATYFCHFLSALSRKYGWSEEGGVVESLSRTSHVVGTARLKHAGTRKINLLLQNAHQMHGAEDITTGRESLGQTNSLRASQRDPVYHNYVLFGESHESAGYLVWTWQQLLSGRLYDTEGVWLPARLWIFQIGQILVAVLLCVLLFTFIETVVESADQATADLPEGLPEWIYDIVPTGRETRIALTPAAWMAVIVCISLILLYIPR
jgi:hypothetical protein